MQKLPVIEVIQEALGIVWGKRFSLTQALMGYALFFTTLDTLVAYLGEDGPWLHFGLTLVYFVMLTLFAVTCHRIVLLDAHAVPRYGLMKWSSRETRFLGWTLGVYCVAGILLLTFSSLSMLASESPASMLLAMLPAAYVFSRLSVLLPATALDERHDMQWAWELTEGNGWRLTILTAVIPGLITVIESRLSSDHLPLNLIGNFFAYALLAIEIAMLSVSFRRLDEMRTVPAEAP